MERITIKEIADTYPSLNLESETSIITVSQRPA